MFLKVLLYFNSIYLLKGKSSLNTFQYKFGIALKQYYLFCMFYGVFPIGNYTLENLIGINNIFY